MKIQRSGLILAVVALSTVIGVGAQAASRTASDVSSNPVQPSPNTTDPASNGQPTSGSADMSQTQPPSSAKPGSGDSTSSQPDSSATNGSQVQTDWEEQMKLAIEETRKFGATLVGMNIDEAEKLAASRGFTVRIIERDGEYFMITMDYRTDRIDVKVANDIITEYSVG